MRELARKFGFTLDQADLKALEGALEGVYIRIFKALSVFIDSSAPGGEMLQDVLPCR